MCSETENLKFTMVYQSVLLHRVLLETVMPPIWKGVCRVCGSSAVLQTVELIYLSNEVEGEGNLCKINIDDRSNT